MKKEIKKKAKAKKAKRTKVKFEPTLSPSVSTSVSASYSDYEDYDDDYGYSPYDLEKGITVFAVRVRLFKSFVKLGLFVGKEEDA